ncbi:MAG: hypothetical protein H7Y60_10300 [Rhodospirillaceae bacterium]|nr:hypothetical protein [Rhodospirillales bacterium]
MLVGLAVERTGDDTIPGHYDAERQVWVVDGPQGSEPIVLTARDSAELVTKTKVQQEQDDPGAMAFLEGSTKTFTQQERDDQGISALLELATKTETRRERDDR